MKRTKGLYPLIPTYENLCRAFRKAAKGKQNRKEVIAFRKDFETNIMKIRDQLLRHEPDIGRYYFFHVFDPKLRSICAASFPERVLHHAIMNICEPALESYMIYDSYACRKGKGNLPALQRAQRCSRNLAWYLKLDIRKYFDTIDHSIMMRLLSQRFKDKELLLLFQKLLETYHTMQGKGMPIGNLISQHLANFYLGCLDHWIKEERRIKSYIRYMDDMLIFGVDKAYLKNELGHIREFLSQKLELELKDNIQLNRCSKGIPFLGFRVFPRTIRLLPGGRKRFVQKFRKYERKWQKGEWSSHELVQRLEPLVEYTKAADAKGFRRNVIENFGVSS